MINLQRQKLEDSRTLNWQREEQAKMEEETERIRADAKRTIDIHLLQHQQMAMQQKLPMESDAKDYLSTEVLRYKQHIDEQAGRERKEMEDQMTAAAQKAALASQNEVAANDKLITAREVIAAQKGAQKQVAAELQRKERAQEEVREATRINQQRMILDKQIQEEKSRKREYFQLKSKNKSKKITGKAEEEADVDDNYHMVSPAKFSSGFKSASGTLQSFPNCQRF